MKKQTPSHRSQAPKLFGLFLALFFGWHLVMGQEPKSIQPLDPNQSLEREMSGKETHRYKVNLQRGEFFQVRVEQKGIDVVLLLHDAEGNELARMDSPNGDRGFEILSFVAESSASFMLEVKSLDEKAGKGAYAIHREVSRTATVEDRKQAATEREQQTQRARLETLTSEVLALLDKIKPSTPPNIFNAALNKAGQGLAIAQSLKSVEHELLFSFMTARIFEKKGENQGALENYESTLKVIDSNKARMAEMKSIEVTVLKKMGRFYENNLVDSEAAAKLYYRALSLYKEGEEDEDKGLLLRYFGDVLDDFRFYTQAAESYLKAIRVFQNLKLKFELGATYGKLGRVYFEQGNKPAEALKYLLEAEDILEDSPLNSEYQETRLYNLGFIYMLYDRLNDPERAAFYRNKASALEAKTNEPFVVFGNKLMLGISLSESGKTEEAAKVYRNALELAKNLSGPEKVTAQTQILTLLGNLCLRTGKGDEAQKFFDQAVNLLKDLDDHTALAGLYEDFGDTLFNGGAFKLAEQYYGKAYSILSDSKGRPKQVDFEQVAGVVNKLGKAQLENGNQSGGIVTLRTALNVEMSLYQQTKLADLLQDRMTAFTQMNKRKLAIFFGKQAVMLKQEMRRTLKTFPIETQKSFLKKNRETYEHLIVLLLQENRLAEAVQIMNFYQSQELFDFDNQGGATNNEISLTQREKSTLTELQRLQSSLRGSKEKFLDNPDFDKLDAALGRMEEDFSTPSDEKDKISTVPDMAEIQSALRELAVETKQKTNALYTLIGSDNFYVLLITPDEVKVFESPIKAADLNEKILEFYALLQSPSYNSNLLGKELYDIIFKPVATELRKTGAQTLMWLLDGNLRYVPVAALWDGEKYLVERYQNVVFTRASKGRMTQAVSPNWTGYGFATSAPHKVELPGRTIEFKPLDFVKNEMQVFRTKAYPYGTIEGDVFSESRFNKDSFIAALKQTRPLVHISSHFAFRPGDESQSFLLLGDGTVMTLGEMKEYKTLFQGVELLTLSACDTAAQLPNANGREIDGFAELAQRLGARSVMASLWKVKDRSTALLMNDFYRKRQMGKLNKAEALRYAQLDLLYGKAAALDSVSDQNDMAGRGDPSPEDIVVDKKYRIPFKPESNRLFAHPYYWSPFVLYGNWK